MNISNASPLWVSEIDLNNVLSDLGGLARPREILDLSALSARAEAAEAMPMAESCNRDLGGEQHLERNAIRA